MDGVGAHLSAVDRDHISCEMGYIVPAAIGIKDAPSSRLYNAHYSLMAGDQSYATCSEETESVPQEI